jgi:hypothetical protein
MNRWEKTNIKMNLGETDLEEVDWINLAQEKDRWPYLMNTIMNIRAL